MNALLKHPSVFELVQYTVLDMYGKCSVLHYTR